MLCDERLGIRIKKRGTLFIQNYLSKNQLKNYLGVSLSTINRKLKELPHVKFGNARKSRVLFPVGKIEKYLEDNSHKIKES